MRPSLTRPVIYTRGHGEEYAAIITRVVQADSVVTLDAASLNDENTYQVFLAVFVHKDHPTPHGVESVGRVWFPPNPVPYDHREPPQPLTWRWPPRV